ncbi:ATP-binding protein [Inhella sp.]|uniref:ATP-binding protein n=1 Tax=Inhella sp. TaxID=1921806 RepID=UPI0035B1CF93
MSLSVRWKGLSLRQQLAVAIGLVCVLALSLAGAGTLFQLHRQAKGALDDTMVSLGELLANRSAAALAFGDANTASENLAALEPLAYVSKACLLDLQGKPLARHHKSNQSPECAEPGSPLAALEYRLPVRVGGNEVGELWLRANDDALMQRLWPSLLALGGGLLFALVVALVAAVPLQRAMHRPLDRIREVATRVEESGDFTPRVPELGRHELGRLGRAFNRMLDTIQGQNDKLAERERHARALFEASHLAQLVVDQHSGRIMDANLAAAALLAPQLEPEILRGSTLWALLHVAPQALPLEGLRFGDPQLLNLQALRGADRWEAEVHVLSMDRDGHRIVHVVMEDVSERRALERAQREQTAILEQRVQERTRHLAQTIESLNDARDQLVLAEKQAALARLVAGMAHEVNTPVGNARLAVSTIAEAHTEFCRLMQTGLRRSELNHFLAQVEEGHQLAERNLQRVVELVAAFKQMSADQASSERRRFDLAQLIEEILRLMAPQLRRAACELSLQLEPGLEMNSQAGPLEQVVVNLVQNALLHGFDGLSSGRLTVEARRAESDQVELSVSDDGRGMTAEILARAFDPFFTTKMGRGGLGLGLPIVQGLVQKLLGGTMQIDSAPDQGTRVTLRLPLEAPSE